MSATKGRRTVLLYGALFTTTKVTKTTLQRLRSVHENDGTNVEGLWGNGGWGMDYRLEEILRCV